MFAVGHSFRQTAGTRRGNYSRSGEMRANTFISRNSIQTSSFSQTGSSRRTARRVAVLSAAALSLLGIRQASAQLYWDPNDATSGAGGASPAGQWNASNANWTTDATGQSPATTWVAGSTAVFAAGDDATGAYTVTL